MVCLSAAKRPRAHAKGSSSKPKPEER
jgi:hypothetical protein